MFRGTCTALVTPFDAAGNVDEAALRALVKRQIDLGIDGLVPVGTTGESPTLTHAEHDRVIEVVVEAAAGRVPVIAGAGSNSTAEALRLTRHAQEVGAAACLQVNPYYNKPSQEGLYRHFMAIADVGLPVVLYNIPGRTGVTLEPATIARLARHEKIVAVKEATGNLDFASQIVAETDLAVLSGDDSLTLPMAAVGGVGVISVISNLLPGRVKAMTAAFLGGDWEAARRLHLELFALFKAMFIETNPVPVKTAMELAGFCSAAVRLPLAPLADANRAKLEAMLRQHEVI
ncbi:MAG: 4-hydroxy-tetrahydrodipicolinate synthase [Phycisphaerae bacterium]|nr:4-hydroxy-tetrahydrodipicolinate synthase [Phycisphaerae bacterium]